MLDSFSVCELFDIKYPIIQGGMAQLGTHELASAVSNAGGLGIIGSGGMPPVWLEEQIVLTKAETDKPFGVNIPIFSPYLEENLKVILDENVRIVAFGAGDPVPYIPLLKEAGIKILPVVARVDIATRLDCYPIDALVIEGNESGGHIGKTSTMALLPQIAGAVKAPVIAAGGIADGKGLVAALALGAQGIQMGTRFICSSECIAHNNFKEEIIKANDRATVVTGITAGHPVRCLENKLTRKYNDIEKSGASQSVLEDLVLGSLYTGVIQGNMAEGSLMIGQIAGLIRDIKPVKSIIEDIMKEAEETIDLLLNHKIWKL